MILRPYQQAAVDDVIAKIDRRCCLVAPTGSGKTVMCSAIVRALDVPTLWLAHRRELIKQASGTLRRYGLHTGMIIAGQREDRFAQVQVASIHTLARRIAPRADLIVIDEAHHAAAETYRAVLDKYPNAHLLGTSATPFRLDGKPLGDLFGELVVAAYPDELVGDGTLVEPVVFAPDVPDMQGVRVRMGEYSASGMAAVMDRPKLVGNIVEQWLKHAAGRKTVCFAVNVKHSQHVVEQFVAAGVRAEHIDGSTPTLERDAILARLASGATTVVSNCMVLTEGWDLPTLECAIIARPTASLNLHLQTIGRIMRAVPDDPGKRALVLDHAGNHHRHGMVTDRIEYSLDDRPKKKSDADGKAPFKRCKSCFALVDLAAETCPECGAAFGGQREAPRTEAGELKPLEAPHRDAPFPDRARFWNDVERNRLAYGYREGWAAHRYKMRFGEWPLTVTLPDGRRELINAAEPTEQQKRAVYRELLANARARGFKDGWAAHQFKTRFGAWPRWSWREAPAQSA